MSLLAFPDPSAHYMSHENFANVLFLTRTNRLSVPYVAADFGNGLFISGIDVPRLELTPICTIDPPSQFGRPIARPCSWSATAGHAIRVFDLSC
jgi:hypothetical protein